MGRKIDKYFLIILSLFCLLLPASAVWSQSAVQPRNLEAIGLRQLVDRYPQLTGRRVKLAIVELCEPAAAEQPGYNFLPNLAHRSLYSADWLNFYYYQNPTSPAGFSRHASMIAGILLGEDELAQSQGLGSFYYQGIAPWAGVSVYEANWFIYKRVLASDLEPVTDDNVVNISWGTDADDIITQWWQRGIDALVEREGSIVVAACGNGQDKFKSISKPSWGYNVISVGSARGLGDYPDYLLYVGPPTDRHSTSGPTDDGRSKPDVIAPGLALGPSKDSVNDYYIDEKAVDYSSFAAPQVAGVAALLIDAARQNHIPDADDPRLIKALILNGANKLIGWHKGTADSDDDSYSPLDFHQGAGLINVLNSHRELIAKLADPNSPAGNIGWDLAQVALDPNDPDSQRIYYLPQPLAPQRYLKATLCWYRHYEPGRTFNPAVLSNLTLSLWAVDEAGHLTDMLDSSDSVLDNLQHIYYTGDVEIPRAALVVSGADFDNSASAMQRETYGLAYEANTDNWTGDQLSGDINADGIVDENDLIQFMEQGAAANNESSNLNGGQDPNTAGRLDEAVIGNIVDQWQQKSPWYHPAADD